MFPNPGPPLGSHHAHQRSFLQDATFGVLHLARRRPRYCRHRGQFCGSAESELQEGTCESICKVRFLIISTPPFPSPSILILHHRFLFPLNFSMRDLEKNHAPFSSQTLLATNPPTYVIRTLYLYISQPIPPANPHFYSHRYTLARPNSQRNRDDNRSGVRRRGGGRPTAVMA